MMIYYGECKTQTSLLRIFVSGKKINHVSGRAGVCKAIEGGSEIIGIIDEDPRASQHPYLRKMKLVKEENRIKLFEDEKKNRLIVICPRLENWILEVARESKIKVSDYNFSEEPNKFDIEAKLSIGKFQQLLHQLHAKQSKSLRTLKKFLKWN